MIRIAQQVSRAIRILRGNRDESARASHLVVEKDLLMTYESAFFDQAEREKCSQSTFSERKIMSTKTAFKRVALVAAAALAIGGVTAVSAYATANPATIATPTFTVTGNTGTASAAVVSSTVGTYTAITFGAAATDSVYSVASAGVGSINVPSIAAAANTIATTGVTATSATIFSAASSSDVPGTNAETFGATGMLTNSLAFSAYSAVAGTQTITITGNLTSAITLTITWGAAPVVSAQYSQIVMLAGSTAPGVTGTAPVFLGGTNLSTTAAPTNAGTARAVIGVVTNSSATHTFLTDNVSASLSGPGTLAASVNGTAATLAVNVSTGRSISATETGGFADFTVFGDGTAGLATITLTDTTAGVVLGTRTVTFYGSGVKAVATQNLHVGVAGTSTTLGNTNTNGAPSTTSDLAPATGYYAYTVAVTDANGNAALATVPKAVSSNTAVIASSTCYPDSVTTGTYDCNVVSASGSISGQSATVTFEAEDSSGNYTILATPLTFTVGGAIASEALSTDATSYNALAPITLTVTAKDSSNNAAYDQGLVTGGTALVSSLLSSTQLGGSLASPTVLINGVGTVTGIYAPAVAGDFTISGTDAISGNGEAATPVTATSLGGSADVSANAATDAANEATDAANAATDAANAAADSADAATQAAQDAGDKADAALAAVTALSQQVTTLLSKVAALATAIAKITKKLKA